MRHGRIRWAIVGVVGLGLAACGSGGRDDPGPGTHPDADIDACADGDTRCDGFTVLAGEFVTRDTCQVGCSTAGCADCDPGLGNTCDAGNVVACNDDWTLGEVVETCGPAATCLAGHCEGVCTADGSDLIYVLGTDSTLRSFDPRKIDDGVDVAFQTIGVIDCVPTLPPLGGFGVQPFSMAVSRDQIAYVLYTSGQIFGVSTETAHCLPTGFVPQQEGMDLFGMGFVTDEPGGTTEHLYVAGGAVDLSGQGDLARIDADLDLTVIGTLTTESDKSPELTGTGLGELWGLFPSIDGYVEQIDKTSGAPVPGTRILIPGGLSTVASWAVAHWGGKLWLFLNSGGPTVRTIDLATGAVEFPFPGTLPFDTVGAGVSTCAPVIID